MRAGLFFVTEYQNLFFTVPCALLEFPGAELGRGAGLAGKGMWKLILLLVLLCREEFKGPLLHPAQPHTQAQLQLPVGSVKPLCQHTEPSELTMCDGPKKRLRGLPLPQGLGC